MLTCPSCGTENPDGSKFCNECGAKLQAAPVREERKFITALFCDLVGSTALGESMDHEDVARLLGSYQTLCRSRIESHGGVVEKFIGDAVVGVFGLPAAHEDDPERAVRAALRIVDDIGTSELPIEVRIGINTGEALVRLDVDPRSGEHFATGDSLNTAARLEAAAPAMGVAVGEATYRATTHAIAYEALPPLVAKGKAEPVAAWRAIEPIARVGTPERDRTPFVGRELELGVLIQLSDRSRTIPSTEFVTIVADPGLGKSRLVRELSRYVENLPELVRWRVGRCLPYGDGIGFWALGEIVKAEAGILETDDQATLRDKLERVVAEPDDQTKTWMIDRLAPLVGLETTTQAPEQTEAFTAWRRFLESLASRDPAVLVIEDLHWADEAFVAFLSHLAERAAGLPLLVVVTARPEIEESRASWPPGRRSTLLSLSPLGERDLDALVRAALPDVSDELDKVILERSGGSPLYAEQLAALVTERALPVAGDGLDEALIPQSVQALIAARIDALPPEAKRVLMEASVVGKTFWAGAVGALAEHDDLESTLAELCRRELCRQVHPSTMQGDAEFSFWHALVRDVSYAGLTKSQRARMHADTARWIADRNGGSTMGEDAEIVVHHVDAALEFAPAAPELDTAPLTELLADALLAAGEIAMRTDIPKAIPLMERLLATIGREDDRQPRATATLGRAVAAAGDLGRARPMLEEAFDWHLAQGDPEVAIRIWDDLVRVTQELGEKDASTEMLVALRARVGERPSRALAGVIALEANERIWEGETEAGIEQARASIAMAEELGVLPPPEALATLGGGRVMLGDLEGEKVVRLAMERLLREGFVASALVHFQNLASASMPHDTKVALELFDEAIALGSRLGVEAEVFSARVGRLEALCFLGRFDDAVSEADPILAWATQTHNEYVHGAVLLTLGIVERHRGGSRVELDELARLTRATRPPPLLAIPAWLAHSRGNDATARELLLEIAGTGAGRVSAAAELAAELGLRDLADQLVSHTRRGPDSNRFGELSLAEGALAEARGDPVEASQRYRVARRTCEEAGLVLGRAWATHRLGRCLLRAGTLDEGTATLHEARALWVEMGAGLRLAEIDELLASVD